MVVGKGELKVCAGKFYLGCLELSVVGPHVRWGTNPVIEIIVLPPMTTHSSAGLGKHPALLQWSRARDCACPSVIGRQPELI